MTATSSRCSTLKCVLYYSKPRKGSSLSPHPKSSPSAMSAAEPTVITQSGKRGHFPIPLASCISAAGWPKKGHQASNPSKKKKVAPLLNLHRTGSRVLVCLAGSVHHRKFSMASLCRGVPLGVKCNMLLFSTPAQEPFFSGEQKKEAPNKLLLLLP